MELPSSYKQTINGSRCELAYPPKTSQIIFPDLLWEIRDELYTGDSEPTYLNIVCAMYISINLNKYIKYL